MQTPLDKVRKRAQRQREPQGMKRRGKRKLSLVCG